jgi:hypothetical protein
MLPIPQPSSKPIHPLARFVNKITAALLFNLKPQQIKRVECWRYIVYVHGEGLSCFVSYADFPPVLAAEPPRDIDFVYWHKRWEKTQNPEKTKQAPDFWLKYFAYQFQHSDCPAQLFDWGKLVNLVKSVLSEAILGNLREIYRQEKWELENF